MALSPFINKEDSRLLNDEFERVCWCDKYKGELYYNKRTGKFKTVGGCSRRCIKAIVIVLEMSIKEERNKKAIEKSIIKSSHL